MLSDVLHFGLNAVDNDLYALKGVQVYITYTRGKDEKSGVNDEHSRIKRIRGFGKRLVEQKFDLAIKDASGNFKGTEKTTVASYIEKSKNSSH